MSWLLHDGVKFLAKRKLPITSVTPASQIIGGTMTFSPSADSRIVAGASAATNYGTETSVVIRSAVSALQRSVHRWNLGALPAAVLADPAGTILSVSFEMYETRYDASHDPVGRTYYLYKLRSDSGYSGGKWTEAEVTWNHAVENTVDWHTAHDGAAGDRAANPSACVVPATLHWMYWNDANALAIVQDAILNCANIVNAQVADSNEATSTDKIGGLNSRENGSYAPILKVTYAYTQAGPSIPANYKFPITVHKGSPSVKDESWIVNGKRYTHYLPFTITALSEVPANYSGVDVVVDTAKLVAAGVSKYFAGSTVAYASTVEFVAEDGVDVTTYECNYWIETALGVPQFWNTDHTPYILRIPLTIPAGNTRNFRMYFDAGVGATQSTNFVSGFPDGSNGAWDYYRDFSGEAADLNAFLSEYPEWEMIKDVTGGDPVVTVVPAAPSVVGVVGGTAAKWSGIRVKSAYFNATNFKCRIRYTTNPATNAHAGMSGGILATGPLKSSVLSTGNANELRCWSGDGATSTDKDMAYPVPGGWTLEVRKTGTKYRYVFYRDRSNGYPDYWTLTNTIANQFNDIMADDVAHMPYLGSLGIGAQYIDYIAVGGMVDMEPMVYVPNVTYDEPGAVFAEDTCLDFPYDLAFTAIDGLTELYWFNDPLSQKSKHPGDTAEITVRSTALDAVHIHYGHALITKADPNPYSVGSSTFDWWDDYATWADYTAISGSFAAADVAESVFFKGDAGNVPLGGGGGRTWARMPCVCKWDTDQYVMVSSGADWEYAGSYWPCRFNMQISYGTTVDGEFGAGKIAFVDPAWSGTQWGVWPMDAKVWTNPGDSIKRLYVLYMTDNGASYRIASCANPYDETPTWVLNTYSLFDATWLAATGNWGGAGQAPYTYGGSMYHDGAKWRVLYEVRDGTKYYIGYCHTTVAPEDWAADSFTDVGPIITTTAYIEDFSLIYDGASVWYIFFVTLESLIAKIRYWDSTDFATWGVGTPPGYHTPTLALAPFAQESLSPRLMEDGGNFYFHYSGLYGAEPASYLGKWLPNLIGCSVSATLNGSFTVCNTVKKAYVSDTTGVRFAYKNNYACPADFEYISEVIQKIGGGETATGLLFRYSSTAQTGYAAFLVFHSGVPTIEAYKIVANALVNFSPAQTYTIPQFPIPFFYPGYSVRLAVQCYGEKIKVGWSPYGNEFVWGLSFSDTLYSGTRIGPIVNAAASYWDRSRVRALTKDSSWLEPSFGTSQLMRLVSGMPSNF